MKDSDIKLICSAYNRYYYIAINMADVRWVTFLNATYSNIQSCSGWQTTHCSFLFLWQNANSTQTDYFSGLLLYETNSGENDFLSTTIFVSTNICIYPTYPHKTFLLPLPSHLQSHSTAIYLQENLCLVLVEVWINRMEFLMIYLKTFNCIWIMKCAWIYKRNMYVYRKIWKKNVNKKNSLILYDSVIFRIQFVARLPI